MQGALYTLKYVKSDLYG